MATYSLSITAISTHNALAPKTVFIDDQYVVSPGAEQRAMQLGTQMFCKLPDGGQAYHTFEADRCIPGVLRIVRRV
jgi:hypothetical protein